MATGFEQPPAAVEPEGGYLGSDQARHLTFGALLAATLLIFSWWAWDHIGTGSKVILVVSTVLAMFMAFNIGGNDVANSFGTSVGAGTLTMKQALLVAAVFEVSGAVIAGGAVTDTVRSGIVDLSGMSVDPTDFVYIMMSALFAAAFWLLFATRMGYPVSTTHSIIGGIVGAALAVGFLTGSGGFGMVQWGQIGQIAISWVLSPVLGGVVSYFLYGLIKRHVLTYNDRADEQLKVIKQERIEHRDRHKEAFERLSELQQISYTGALARDAVAANRPDFDPGELESDYYRELHEIDAKTESIDAYRALQTWVPLLAAFGAVLGIGIVNHSTYWGLMRPIALAWVITLPAAAILGAVGVLGLRAIF